MTQDSLQAIAAAVTPAVMVSACALAGLGLDNQGARMTTRLREFARELRASEPGAARAENLRRQIAILDRRHGFLTWALTLDYAALFLFVLTSLVFLARHTIGAPILLALFIFGLGVLFLGGVALCALASLWLARDAIRLELTTDGPLVSVEHDGPRPRPMSS